MALRDALLPEYDHEMATTRRLLERVPEADLAWKPHEKSMSLGELSEHIANLALWCRMTSTHRRSPSRNRRITGHTGWSQPSSTRSICKSSLEWNRQTVTR
jgi:hypothetical protein